MPGEPTPRDLILRPTSLEPGLYPADDDGEPRLVVRHASGRNYELIWCASGEGKFFVRVGDTLCERAYLRDVQTTFPSESPIKVVPVETDGYAELVRPSLRSKTRPAKAKKTKAGRKR